MDRQEAVQRLSKGGRLSIAHAEDLYDSFFPKPVVPQCAANWYENFAKSNFGSKLLEYLCTWDDNEDRKFKEWFNSTDNVLTILVNMHQFGYEVESEKEYVIELKNSSQVLLYEEKNEEYYFAERCGIFSRESHTRKELEANGFDWVFNCEGVEVKEVE